MLTLASAKLTGIPGASSWSQVHEFLPEDPDKIKTRGHLFAVIAAKEAGREVLTRLHEEYFGDTTIKPFNALRFAVEKVAGEFPDIEIAAIAFVEGVIYSAATGGSQVTISRAQSLATILASKVGETASASGFPEEGDLMLLGTKGFFEKVSQIEIKSALETSDPLRATEDFTGIIHKSAESGEVAAVIVKFEERPEVQAEVMEAPKQIKIPLIERIKKFIPERRIYIKPPIDFETTPQAKKTTLFVGIILLIILAVSITFGVRQKNIKEKENQIAKTEAESKSREEAGYYNANPELFLDLTLLSSGFKGDRLSASGENLFILDKNGKRVVSVEIASKKSKVAVGSGKAEEALDMASYDDRVFLLTSDGIGEAKETMESAVEKDWESEALIHAFAGNLYVLDKTASQIYRYAGNNETFGSKQDWLSASTKPDLSGAKSWTFDGAIYVLTNSGKVVKFSQGSPQNFSLPPEVTSADAIFADEENDFIYVLDKAGKKVVVVGKSGEFKAQYSSESISEAVEIAASEKERKIILLTGEKLLSIEMRHPLSGKL